MDMQRERSIRSNVSRGTDPEMQWEHSISLRQRSSQRTDAKLRSASFCTVGEDGDAITRTPSELRARRGREVHEEMPHSGRIALRAGRLAARHPCKAFCSCWAVVLAITMVGIFSGELAFSEEGPKDWMVLDDVHSQALDAIELAEAEVDCIPVNGTCPQLPTRSQPNRGMLGFSIIYQADEGGDVFTPERLQQACTVERVFLQNKYYPQFCALQPGALELATEEGRELRASDCQAQTLSVAQLFYGHADGAAADCELLNESQVDERRQSLEIMLEDTAQKLQAGFYVGADSSGLPNSGRTRSLLGLGYPLEGYSGIGPTNEALLTATMDFWEQLESDMLEHFGKRHSQLRTAFWEEWRAGDVEVLFNSEALRTLETTRVVNSDMNWLIVSILFVWACLGWRTGSLFVGTVSLLQIVFSIPVAFFFYRFVFQIAFFQQLHGILIFIMLGIGADAVFVFSDAWQQSEELLTGLDPHQSRTDEERVEDLTARLALAYQRTMTSVFNTSFTTAVAFLATAISPIMPIRTMGIFACLLVLSNYVFVITLTPSAFAVWQAYRVDLSRCCCCCCWQGRPEATASEEAPKRPLEEPKLSWLARCYLPVFGRPSVALASLLIFAGWGGLNCYWAAQLEPPPEMFQFFGKEHMHSRAAELSSSGFLAGGADDYLVLQFSFGIEGVNRSPNSSASVDPWAPHLFYGVPVWNSGFDLSQPAAQEFLRDFCQRLRTEPCASSGCSDGLLVQPGPNAVSCFIEEFDAWAGGTFEDEEFTSELQAFRNTQTPQQVLNNQATWEKGIGFVGGELRYVEVQAMLTVKRGQPGSVKEEVLDTVMRFLDRERSSAPAAAGDILQTVGVEWVFLVIEQTLIKGLFDGFAICFPTAFVVLLLATGNVLVALYAITTIGAIVMSVLGWCWAAEGWYLGISESIAGVIVIGLAVDYVIHLGHMYLEVGHLGYETRAERCEMALKNMGVTVLAGAVTTLAAGLSMRFCQMTFFLQMSTLISVTIAYSLLFSLFFFMCLLRVAGPERDCGDVSRLIRRACSRGRRETGADEVPPPAAVATSPDSSGAKISSL